METWIVFAVIAVPLIGVLLFLAFDDSFVRIEPGTVGLILVRGKATDRALLPGPHWVPVLRRTTVQEYPSLELAYRASDGGWTDSAPDQLENSGPALRVLLGDRAAITVSYTVRFRLDPEMLKVVHNRFGPEGIWAAVRDQSSRAVRAALRDPALRLDDLFGPGCEALQESVGAAVTSALAGDGLQVTNFTFGDFDLGRTGEVIQATVRARFELEREEAEAATRQARARIDAEMQPFLGGAPQDAALRYREIDAWRDLLTRTVAGAPPMSSPASLATPGTSSSRGSTPVIDEETARRAEGQ